VTKIVDTLSIVIPAYNEEQRLPATLERILQWAATAPLPLGEIVVVDDGSRDGTAALVESGKFGPLVRVLRNPGNRGKGYAVRNGMLSAAGDWILSTDADLSAPIEEVAKLIEAARREQAVIAIGSRALDRSLIQVHQPLLREYSGRAFNLVMRLATGLPFRDTQCGFKLFRRDAAREIFKRQIEDGFSFDVENLVIARVLGLKAVEVPVVWSNVEGTKVSMAQGMKSFADLLRIRWNAIAGKYR
jgi:glycosyltransferase involved in cell wall biosynthesis